MFQRHAEIILDVPIDTIPVFRGTQISIDAIDGVWPQVVFACANPHSLVAAQSDAEFKRALIGADFVVADGVGLTFMAGCAGIGLGPRITGTDYFVSIMNALSQRGRGRVFFFGSSQHVLDLIAQRFAMEFPALTLCGMLSPPYSTWDSMENRRMVKAINDAKPDVLWVGMTAPKQEKWVETNRRQLTVPVIGSIGAVFDFYAGTYSRAPKWVCNIGLEWAYRFILEPRRMWRRNFVSAPKFIWLVLRQHIFSTHSTSPPTSLSDAGKNTYRSKKAA